MLIFKKGPVSIKIMNPSRKLCVAVVSLPVAVSHHRCDSWGLEEPVLVFSLHLVLLLGVVGGLFLWGKWCCCHLRRFYLKHLCAGRADS